MDPLLTAPAPAHPSRRWLRLPAFTARTHPWLRRYLVLDLAGWLGGLGLGCLAHAWCGVAEATALAGLLGENLGFYGVALLRELRAGSRATARGALRRLVTEFALAECLDSALIRPLALIVATRLATSPVIGLCLGSAVADLSYYSIAAWASRRARAGPEAAARTMDTNF